MAKFNEWTDAGEGIRRKIFQPGAHMMSMQIEFKKGAFGSPHSHPHEQLGFVVSGALELTIDGVRQVYKAGEQMHVPGNAVHAVTALEDSVLLEMFTPLRADLLATIEAESDRVPNA